MKMFESTAVIYGKTGGPYGFTVYKRENTFAKIGGIYILAKPTGNVLSGGKYFAIYVGQTGNLFERPLNHHRKACFDRNGANLVLVHYEQHERTRLAIEGDIIRALNPPCNQQ